MAANSSTLHVRPNSPVWLAFFLEWRLQKEGREPSQTSWYSTRAFVSYA